MNRKQEREQAFIMVFEKMFREESMEEIFECAVEARDYSENEYVRRVSIGVYEHIDEIDGYISNNSKGWSISRISKVALACMRIAIYEMLYCDDIPVSVSINEAVELIKNYATEKDSSFANGIMGTIAQDFIKNE
ncbi:MAG: transcription antitermination factor NusB [Ruminococcaceae bacterium]|nr:transcription antitermination factor NusB [Oscillospiraceae bacterium]